MTTLPVEAPRRRVPLTRPQVQCLVNGGLILPGSTEYINGELLEKTPQYPPHVNATKRSRRALEAVFGWEQVASQSPLRTSDLSDPEPDVFVTRQSTETYPETPTAADCVLVVEVSDATLTWDRTEKLKLYSGAVIEEYWIVDVNNRRLIVHRRPSGDEFLDIRTFTETETVSPLSQPTASVAVADLLP